MKIAINKQKLTIFELPNAFDLIGEILKEFDKQERKTQCDNDYYCMFLQKYGMKLKRDIQEQDITPPSVQLDLEDEIQKELTIKGRSHG